ncbi:predicted protein [Pyrenophora tritici-repentis Pt-1C-BFP]|uniref:Uncharacterized protein n=1 Tax=Pyrenophora tritici-repentis (strain Pt-1C-BFP) TaxID=426418 RepID=B2VUN4_PYRTR|nr:uncharacterized protein PTRG_02138 [Pyrenophora tritici-repentis Pt-1C-BFP]EDU41576.1 predicted protein [Pyrenophora tritici-repentis Pt-1C-BFP]
MAPTTPSTAANASNGRGTNAPVPVYPKPGTRLPTTGAGTRGNASTHACTRAVM